MDEWLKDGLMGSQSRTHRAKAENPSSSGSEALLAFPLKLVATSHLTEGRGLPVAWQRTCAPV